MRQNVIKRLTSLFLAALMLPLFACTQDGGNTVQQSGTLRINEVVSSNGESLVDDTYGSPDWIELYNGSDRDVNLFNYIITDDLTAMDKGKYYLLPDVTLKAGGYLVLYANKSDAVYESGTICLNFALKKNGGEQLAILDVHEQVVDSVTLPAMEKDISYARIGDQFLYCSKPTPAAANASKDCFDSLELAVAAAAQPPESVAALVINEVVSANVNSLHCAGCDKLGDWIELYNPTNTAQSVDRFTLTDDPLKMDQQNLPAVTIEAGGLLLVYCCRGGDCDKSDGHVCVDLGVNNDGETLYLFDAWGSEIANLTVPALDDDVSYARRSDGSYGYCKLPTPNGVNDDANILDSTAPEAMGADAPVRINEVLPHNRYSLIDRDGDRSDWVELYNSSAAAVSLTGYYLSDSENNYMLWALPDVTIEAGGYLIVFLSGKDRTEDGELHASFRLSDGETVYLYDANTARLDSLPLPETLRDNISVGRAADGSLLYYTQPTPGSENAHAFTQADQIGFFQTDGLYISEVCAAHAASDTSNDWIELYNGGTQSLDLTGYRLTNDIDEPDRFILSGSSIAAGGYLVVEASAHSSRQTSGVAPYGVSSTGEELFLLSPQGLLVDVFSTGVQQPGDSSGRVEGDSSIARVFFTEPTRGSKNSGSTADGYASQPIFSETGLYQSTAFQLSISCLDSSASIYYTTDGSAPTSAATKYTDPISVAKSGVVRAVAVSGGLLNSEITTCHYLFTAAHTVPVACIAMDPNDFAAIYRVKVNKDIFEREAYLSYYEADGRMGTEFPMGLSVKGHGTLVYAQKSFTLRLRSSYGQKTVTYPFFDDYPYTEFGTLVLRNGGQDYDQARLRDPFMSHAVQGMNVEAAMTRVVVVYVNGEYYGIYDLGEDLNAEYLTTHYGADKDAVDVIRTTTSALHGNNKEIKRVYKYAEAKDLSVTANYEEFLQWVDADYYMDYVVAQTYFNNSDTFNQKYWRTQDYSIKWRPVLFDLDFALRNGPSGNMMGFYNNMSGFHTAGQNTFVGLYVTSALYENAEWRQKLIERYVECIETYFAPARLTALLDEMTKELEPEMQRHIDRWGKPSSMSVWKKAIQTLRERIEARPEYAYKQLQSYFHLSDSELAALKQKYAAP